MGGTHSLLTVKPICERSPGDRVWVKTGKLKYSSSTFSFTAYFFGIAVSCYADEKRTLSLKNNLLLKKRRVDGYCSNPRGIFLVLVC